VAGRHKVSFVPIKTSGTDTYVDIKKKGKGQRKEVGRDETAGDGMTAKHRAKIQLRSNRSFRRSWLLTKFAIYDPGKPKRTSFHDIAGRYLLDNDTIEPQTRVVRRNDEDIGRDAHFNETEKYYQYIHISTYVCLSIMRVRTHVYV